MRSLPSHMQTRPTARRPAGGTFATSVKPTPVHRVARSPQPLGAGPVSARRVTCRAASLS